MNDAQPDRRFLVQLSFHPEAQTFEEAYLMSVDSLIRYGSDFFHAVIQDRDTGEQAIFYDGQVVRGEALHAALAKLEEVVDGLDESANQG